MFTGIIETVGTVERIDTLDADSRLVVNPGRINSHEIKAGGSIAINGVCLTVTRIDNESLCLDVSNETLSVTNLGCLQKGSRVNLERSLQISDRLDGHIVSGHVDAVGSVVERRPDGRSEQLVIEPPEYLVRYISKKGSICVDGVSLTINEKNGNRFAVNIIPHTLEQTIIADYQVGTPVNIEVDIIARYLESLYSSS